MAAVFRIRNRWLVLNMGAKVVRVTGALQGWALTTSGWWGIAGLEVMGVGSGDCKGNITFCNVDTT